MTIVGFNFTKLLAEKNKSKSGEINVSNNISIKEVKKAKLNMGKSKRTGLEINFQFLSKYNPEIGKIELHGKVVMMEKEDKIKKVLEVWEEKKSLPRDIVENLYNSILRKCNVQAIVMSRDIQLPPPIPMPKVKKGKK